MAAIQKILIVEDDYLLREALVDYLSRDNKFSVVGAGTLREAEAALNDKAKPVAVLILDIDLPDGNGRDFCVKLRQRDCNLPVIFLSGASGVEDIVRGLDAGASDYIVKPFGPEELKARVRAALRIFDSSVDATFAIGCYTFHPSARRLEDMVRKRRVRLTQKEVAILKVLYQSDTQPVARQALLDAVWGVQAVCHDAYRGGAYLSSPPKDGTRSEATVAVGDRSPGLRASPNRGGGALGGG